MKTLENLQIALKLEIERHDVLRYNAIAANPIVSRKLATVETLAKTLSTHDEFEQSVIRCRTLSIEIARHYA